MFLKISIPNISACINVLKVDTCFFELLHAKSKYYSNTIIMKI